MTDIKARLQEGAKALSRSGAGYYARSLSAFSKKVLIFVRQSSAVQVRKHVNSTAVQIGQIERFNVPADRIEYVMALGETGTASDDRHEFEHLLQRLASGEIGVVVVARHDRLGRNNGDHARAMGIMREQRIVLMVDGHVFDPSSAEDAMILNIYATFAEYENNLRTRWMRLTKLSAARGLSLRMPLPAPYIWASPDDAEYVRLLRQAGLGNWLEGLPTGPGMGKAYSLDDGRRLFPLPFPDAEVMRACTLMLRFLVEEDSVSDAVDRTLTDPDWPSNHRGEFPSFLSRKFKRDKALVRWMSCDREIVSRWAMLPALRGTYQHFSSSLAKDMSVEEKETVRVVAKDAFRALVGHDEARRIAEVVGSGIKKKRNSILLRLHSIPRLYCGHRDKSGKPCGRRLYPSHPDGRHKGYTADICNLMGHTGTVGGHIDGFVLDALAEALAPEVLAAHLDVKRLQAGSRVGERGRLKLEIARVSALKDDAASLELASSRKEDVGDFEHYKSERQKHTLELKRLNSALAVLTDDEDSLRAATASEVAEIVQLGTDLPALVKRMKQEPALARRLLKECLVAVHVSTPGKYITRLELEFPTGRRVARWLMSSPIPSTQAMRVYSSLGVESGRDPQAIADEIARFQPPHVARLWSARRVLGCALMHEHFESETPRKGVHQTLSEIAHRVGAPLEDALGPALRGDFGPARKTRDGDGHTELSLRPTENELHSAFPEYARRSISTSRRWPLADTIRLADAARATWQHSVAVLDRVRKIDGRGSVVRDLAGRSYVRLSVARVDGIVKAAEALFAARPDMAALEPTGWGTPSEKRLSGWEAIAPFAPSIELPTAVPGISRTFYWVGPSVLRMAAAASLRDALAGANLPQEYFVEMHQGEHAFLHFRARFPKLSHGIWHRRLMAPDSEITRIDELGIVENGLREVRYIHVPVTIYETEDIDAFNRWLIVGYAPALVERRGRQDLREKFGLEKRHTSGGRMKMGTTPKPNGSGAQSAA